jgi:dipeptidyl aminopeptidase/acylaminoacyl peptidase
MMTRMPYNLRRQLRIMMWILLMLVTLPGRPGAQTNAPAQLLDWIEVKDTGGVGQQMRKRLNSVTEFFVRITSPDVPRDARRLWRISPDGSQNCWLTEDTGLRFPRWGAAGYILYLQEADTNHDGRIDFKDDYLIRVIPAAGGTAKTVAQGKSAVWSPEGKYIAFMRDDKVMIATLTGESLSLGQAAPVGKLILANSRNPTAAHDFWAVDSKSEAKEVLPAELSKKYLWMGQLSPSGTKIVVPNTMKTGLEVRNAQDQKSTKEIASGDFHFMDPTWSPDETQIVYVSDRPRTGAPCLR